MNNETFLVIGSNSFSGSTFIRLLIEEEYNVIGCSRSEELESSFLQYKWLNEYEENFKFHKVDLNNDLDLLFKLVKDIAPSYIVNFAAQGMVAESWNSPEHWYRTNLLSQVKLHDELRKYKFIKKYIHVTTPEVYGSTNGWIKENYNFNPSTPYAVSRASCDLHLNSFFKAYNFPVVFTRAANVYGPGQQLYRIIPRTILFALLNKKLSLHGGGFSERSFIHINDVVDATLKIALDGNSGNTYHISTQKTISIQSLVNKICEKLGKNFSEVVLESEERLGKDQSYMLDSDKLRKSLNWEDSINLDSGIDTVINWINNNIKVFKKMPHNYIHKI